jgi:DNA-binding XRE family transcriptional regulator
MKRQQGVARRGQSGEEPNLCAEQSRRVPEGRDVMKKWKDLREQVLSPEAKSRVDHRVAAALLEMDLRQLREELGLTQEEVAAKVKISQAQLSRMEKGEVSRLSTLRKIVESLGGELEVTAVVKGKRVRLAGV